MAEHDNEAYWIDRHEKLRGKTAAVGNIGSTEADNLQRYARKKRRIFELLRAIGPSDLLGISVLEGGCGVGLVCELFYALGADISGVDISPIAIIEARNRCPGGNFQTASLLDFRFQKKFDLTFCIDVLYHVVHEENWIAALANLAMHTKTGGRFVILDQFKEEPHSPAPHVQFRTKAMYHAALSRLGGRDCTPAGQEHFLVYVIGNEDGR